MRLEHEGLGQMELPEEAYWGIVSERNRKAFDVGPLTLDNYPSYIRAIALCKIACARANAEIGALDPEKAKFIEKAAWEVAEGKFKGNFVVNIYRGSGTPANMIVNEVIAHRANELMTGDKAKGTIHPNTHVNMCQSTNDLIPSAKEMVVYDEMGKVIKASEYFAEVLRSKADEFADVIKMGRTCLQDAVPMTLGQEFGAFAHAAERLVKRLKTEQARWNQSCIGGTCVGTGMGCMPGFRAVIDKHLSEVCGRPIHTEEDLYDGMMATDGLVIAHAHLQALATLVWKVARDIRLLGSGPRAGFGEINLPAVAPGSSIMPGKVNPVIPEMVFLSTDRVCANHAGLVSGVLSGWLELGTSSGIPIKSFIESADLISRTMRVFTDKCIKGITANRKHCLDMTEKSTSLATMVSALFGYEIGTKIAHIAIDEGITCKEAAKKANVLPDSVIEELFDVNNLVDPNKMEALFKKYQNYRSV